MPINLDIWYTEIERSQGKPGLHIKVKIHMDNLLRPYLKRKNYMAGSKAQACNTRFGMKMVTFIFKPVEARDQLSLVMLEIYQQPT